MSPYLNFSENNQLVIRLKLLWAVSNGFFLTDKTTSSAISVSFKFSNT